MTRRLGLARLIACGLSVAVATGCIRQRLSIRSEPPGAELWINDHSAGTTPYDKQFLWYGWYRLILSKPGYDRLEDRVLIRSPWYLWMPLDLVMELLPVTIRDNRNLSYHLIPSKRQEEPTPPVVTVPSTKSAPQPLEQVIK